MARIREKLARLVFGSKYAKLQPQIDSLNHRVGFLESLLVDPRKLWLFQNRHERMDANVEDLFDKQRRQFHLARYEFAVPFVEDQEVLDLASGTGYGGALLAQSARSVVGIDIDADAVAYAHDVYGSDNCRFRTGNGEAIELDDETIDVVTSFETIEHVPSDQKLLAEFHRVLRPGGLLIISTPNQWPLEIAEFHVREYDYQGFCEVLEKWFLVEDMHNQNSGSPSPYNRDQPAGITRTTPENRDLAECYIAICRKPVDR
jgi:ubiquinone/menaquinone biosynthesis C-methylase UbiE